MLLSAVQPKVWQGTGHNTMLHVSSWQADCMFLAMHEAICTEFDPFLQPQSPCLQTSTLQYRTEAGNQYATLLVSCYISVNASPLEADSSRAAATRTFPAHVTAHMPLHHDGCTFHTSDSPALQAFASRLAPPSPRCACCANVL